MPNVLRAEFQTSAPLTSLQKMTVWQKFGNHTLTFLDYKFMTRYEYVLPPEKTPLRAAWGVSPVGVRSFYGYVNHYETTGDERDKAFTRLIALGTSQVMNAASPTTWNDTTPSAIARDFAKRHKMRSIIHDHPWVMENWATGPATDWAALRSLADQVGYLLWVDGATLFFLDPKKVLATASTLSVPVVRDSDVISTKILGGSNVPGLMHRSRRRLLYGLDYTTNEFFQATAGDISAPNEVLPGSITTFSEGEQLAEAATRKEGDYYAAEMVLKGNATLRPGSLFRTVSGKVNSDQAGIWMISEARHEITSKDFTTKVVATRAADGKPSSRMLTTMRGTPDQISAVVRDGKVWEATLQEHIHV